MTESIRQLEVVVNDKGNAAGRRKVVVELEAASDLFMLSDMLAREGAVMTLGNLIQKRLRDAALEYIGSGREVLRGVKERRKSREQKKSGEVRQD